MLNQRGVRDKKLMSDIKTVLLNAFIDSWSGLFTNNELFKSLTPQDKTQVELHFF